MARVDSVLAEHADTAAGCSYATGTFCLSINVYLCSATIGTYTYPYVYHYPNDAGTLIIPIQLPNTVYTVPVVIGETSTATSATACTDTSLRGFKTELSYSAKEVGILVNAIGTDYFQKTGTAPPSPPYTLNGAITSFPITTIDATNTTANYDLAVLYGEFTAQTGIPIPNETITFTGATPNAANFWLPAINNPDGGTTPVQAPVTTPSIFPVGGTAGTMTWNPGSPMTATISFEPQAFGAGADPFTYPTSCELLAINPPGTIAQVSIPKTIDCHPPDAATTCAAAAALDPLGAALANCAGDYCCSDLTTCLADDTSESGCAALAQCFVQKEADCVAAADGGVTATEACSNAGGEFVSLCAGAPLFSTTAAENDLFTALACAQGSNSANVACTTCAPANNCVLP